jgi:polyisoprenoid-binding protein YceI
MNFKSVTMKSIVFCSGSIFALSTYAATWSLTANSQVGFKIESMGVTIVKGQFQKFQSQLDFDVNNPQAASTQFVMNVDSLSINKSSLKNMIMGQDLFYAEKYPTASFKSISFKPLTDHKYLILGQLTLRNVTKPVTFNATIKPDPNNPKLMDFKSSTTIKRSDFGMKKALGGVGENVNIQVSGQWKAK